MIEFLSALGAIILEIVKLETAPTPDPEAQRQALLKAQRVISDELMRRGF